MLSKASLLGCFLLAFAVGNSLGETVNWTPCEGSANERNPKSTIHSVDISPCAEAPDNPCRIVAGVTNLTVSVDFTPTVKMGKRSRQNLYWTTSITDLQLVGMPNKACKNVNCNLKANVRRTWSAPIPLKASFPKNTYPVKVKITEGSKVYVCLVVKVELVAA